MNIVMGIDINIYEVQVSYAALGEAELNPVTLDLATSREKMNVETAICKRKDVNQWYYGADAVKKGLTGQGTLVEHLWELLSKQDTILLDGAEFEVAKLCNLFLNQILRAAVQKIGEELQDSVIEVQMLAVTALPFTEEMTARVESALTGLIIPRERILYQPHEESLFLYLTHQPKRLNGYETGVMDLTEETLLSYRIEMNHKTRPIVTTVRRSRVNRIVRKKHYESITEHDRALEALDKSFQEYVDEFTDGRLVTTIYLVGNGFQGDWCKESLKSLCRNRKVFAGNNLYSKGAVYGAYDRLKNAAENPEYIYLGDNMLQANIGIFVNTKDREQYEALLDAGTNWYEAKSEFTCMVDSAEEIKILITPVESGKTYEQPVSLQAFDTGQPHPFKLRLSLEMISSRTLQVTLFDEGLGSFYPPSKLPIQCQINLREDSYE